MPADRVVTLKTNLRKAANNLGTVGYVFQSNKRRSEHRQGQTNRRRRVEPERHCRDSRVSRAPGQPEREPCINDVADKHAESGAGKHARENNVRRELKSQNQNAG